MLTHFLMDSPKLKNVKVFKIKDKANESKAFSKSISSRSPGTLFSSVKLKRSYSLCGGWLAGDRMAPNTSRNCAHCLDHDSHYLEPKNNEFINAVEKNMLCNAINELLNFLSRTSVIFLYNMYLLYGVIKRASHLAS